MRQMLADEDQADGGPDPADLVDAEVAPGSRRTKDGRGDEQPSAKRPRGASP